MTEVTLQAVQEFWEQHPLFVGESRAAAGSDQFFAEHEATYRDDVFAGALDEALFPPSIRGRAVLDLGCGIGFWAVELARRGAGRVVGVDLTSRALELTKMRWRYAALETPCELIQGNAEALPFRNGEFAHVNCQGVIHHTPHPDRAVAEIVRVLEPGGTASISVYYDNLLLTLWPMLSALLPSAVKRKIGLAGRGREALACSSSVDEIVRRYDGADNPLGVSFSRGEFRALLATHGLEVERLVLHFFPRRAVWPGMPRILHRALDRSCGFMIFANCRKPLSSLSTT